MALVGLLQVGPRVAMAAPSAGGEAAQATNSMSLTLNFSDFFNVPYGEWWDIRQPIYGDSPIDANCFNATSVTDGVCTPSDASLPPVSGYPYADWYPLVGGPTAWGSPSTNPAVYAPYRMRAVGVNVPGYDLSQPVFLPVMNYSQAPGNRLDFNWRANYIDYATADYLTNIRGCPGVSRSQLDGYIVHAEINLTMDLQESKRVFGVAPNVTTMAGAQWWWNTNTNSNCYLRGAAETALENWFQAMGGSNVALGKYDITNAFLWYYQPFYTDMVATVDPDGTTHVTIDHAAWGTETLLARMFYWGNASYSDNYLDSTRAKGWLGMEVPYPEGVSFSGSLGTGGFNFTCSAVMQYHFQELALPGADGVFKGQAGETGDDVPYWSWGPILGDITNDFSPSHTRSELDRYVPPTQATTLTYVHSTPGGSNYGKALPYDYVPATWDLAAGQSWHFQFPAGAVVFHDPNLTPLPANPKGGYVEASATVKLLMTNPASYGSWNATASTWDVVGPSITGGPLGYPGSYPLDPWGAIALGPTNATIVPRPFASFTYSPAQPVVGSPVTFNASSSYSSGATIVDYRWTWGDGSSTDAGTSWTVVHTYGSAGYYPVTLQVQDSTGAMGGTAQSIYVASLPPVPKISRVVFPIQATLGQRINIFVEADNIGSAAQGSSLRMSFPTAASSIQILGTDFSTAAVYWPGQTIDGCYGGCVVTLTYPAIVAGQYDLPAGSSRYLNLTVTPSQAGNFTFYVNYDLRDYNWIWYHDPATSGFQDERYEYVYTYVIQVLPGHDVAVTNASLPLGNAFIGDPVTILATVANHGQFTESFSVAASADGFAVASRGVTLAPGASSSLALTWDTAGAAPGNHTVTVTAGPVAGEYNTGDNRRVAGTVVLQYRVVTVDVTGSFDYLIREAVRIKVAALVKDATTGLTVSNATVTLQIYNDASQLWVSGTMVQKIPGSGIYEWTSSGTILALNVKKGLYLVRVTASYKGGPAASAITMFHVDPPPEGATPDRTLEVQVGGVMAIAMAAALAIAWTGLRSRRGRRP